MKKITLQLKTVANPKQKEKSPLGGAYLNILKQQTSNIKLFKPTMITKPLKNTESESSPKTPTNFQQKSDNKIIIRRDLDKKDDVKIIKSTTPTTYTLNLNVEVEKPPIFKESASPYNDSSIDKNSPDIKNLNNPKIEDLNCFCINHPKKKAKYFKICEDTVSSEENIERQYYCSKCSISLALKGTRVYDLLNPNSLKNNDFLNSSQKNDMKSLMKNILLSSDRNELNEEEEIKLKKQEIESFIAELETVQNSGVNSLSLLNQKKKEISLFYEKQSHKIEDAFKSIIDNLELCKKNVFEKLKSSSEENEFLINNYHSQISNSLKDMNYIHSDISQNLDNIIKNMDKKPFTIILNKYHQKLKNYEIIYQNLNKEKIVLNHLQFNFSNLQGKPFKFEEEIWRLINPYFGNNFSDINKSEIQNKKNENNFYISFDDKEAFEKSPLLKEKYTNRNEKNTPHKILNTTLSEKENINSPNTQKYLKLLQKVSNNQENTNMLYKDIMKNNNSNYILKASESTKNLKLGSAKKNDEKDFQKFFSKLEKKIEIEEIKTHNNTYQKHLFCSPHFKEANELD